MAERRMFAKTIIDSDAFLDMPLSAQALYFHLSMRADDEGFLGNPKRIRGMIGASEDDLKLLIVKRFLISFKSGVVVIRHWRIHNYIQSDRYKETAYVEEKSSLSLDGNKAYTQCIQDGYNSDTQVSIELVKSKNREVSKKVSKEREDAGMGAGAYARESYDELLDRLGFREELKKQVFKFIAFQQANGKIVTNSMLESTMQKIHSMAEGRIRESIEGDFLDKLQADLTPYQGDIEQFIAESIQQALDGGWFELKAPKGFKTSGEWEKEAAKDLGGKL